MNLDILKKLKLNKLYFNFAKKIYAHKQSRVNYEAALAYLQDKRPDKGESCVLQQPLGIAEEYMLDIIMPAYNVEKYIQQSIESVLQQKTKYSYRLLVVDDGSTDRTGLIADKYNDNEKVVVVHTENRGIATARNTALNMLNSKYLMFLDSDDRLAENAIENLLDCAIKENADIVEGAYSFISEDSGRVLKKYMHKSGNINNSNELYGFPWGKVYRSLLFANVQFPNGYTFEDSICRHIIYPLSHSICGIAEQVYEYRHNPKSISHVINKGNLKGIDSLWITISLYEDRKKLGICDTAEYYEYVLKMIGITYRRTKGADKSAQEAIFTVFSNFVNHNLGSYTTSKPDYRDLEYSLKHNDYGLYQLWQKCIG